MTLLGCGGYQGSGVKAASFDADAALQLLHAATRPFQLLDSAVAVGYVGLRREDNLKIWYLHVWAWLDNRKGVFADFHPAAQCAPDARKVFKPSSAS
jgi:hypothetical protein